MERDRFSLVKYGSMPLFVADCVEPTEYRIGNIYWLMFIHMYPQEMNDVIDIQSNAFPEITHSKYLSKQMVNRENQIDSDIRALLDDRSRLARSWYYMKSSFIMIVMILDHSQLNKRLLTSPAKRGFSSTNEKPRYRTSHAKSASTYDEVWEWEAVYR